jgi:hypothetical protein
MSHQDVVMAMWVYGIFGHQPNLSAVVSTPLINAVPEGQVHVFVESASMSEKQVELQGKDVSLQRTSHCAQGSEYSTSASCASVSEIPIVDPSRHAAEQHVVTGACSDLINDTVNNDTSVTSHSDRCLASRGASSSAPFHPTNYQVPSALPPTHTSLLVRPGVLDFVCTLTDAVQRRLKYLNPQGIANAIKALGCLRVSAIPEVQALAKAAAKSAEAHMEDYRPDEISNLLYGLSLLRCSETQVCTKFEDGDLCFLDFVWFDADV